MNTSFYQTISWKEKKKINFELLFFVFHFFLPFCGDVFPPVKINGIIIYLEMYMYYRLSHADKFFAHVLVYLYFYFKISFLSS